VKLVPHRQRRPAAACAPRAALCATALGHADDARLKKHKPGDRPCSASGAGTQAARSPRRSAGWASSHARNRPLSSIVCRASLACGSAVTQSNRAGSAAQPQACVHLAHQARDVRQINPEDLSPILAWHSQGLGRCSAGRAPAPAGCDADTGGAARRLSARCRAASSQFALRAGPAFLAAAAAAAARARGQAVRHVGGMAGALYMQPGVQRSAGCCGAEARGHRGAALECQACMRSRHPCRRHARVHHISCLRGHALPHLCTRDHTTWILDSRGRSACSPSAWPGQRARGGTCGCGLLGALRDAELQAAAARARPLAAAGPLPGRRPAAAAARGPGSGVCRGARLRAAGRQLTQACMQIRTDPAAAAYLLCHGQGKERAESPPKPPTCSASDGGQAPPSQCRGWVAAAHRLAPQDGLRLHLRDDQLAHGGRQRAALRAEALPRDPGRGASGWILTGMHWCTSQRCH